MVAVGCVNGHQVAPRRGYVAVEPDHVNSALGQKTGVTRQVFVERRIVHRPEPSRCAVAENKIVAILGPGDKTMLPGNFLVETAQIQQRLRTELVARRLESPSARA